MNKIIIATNNSKKLSEIQMLLNDFNIEALPQSQFNIGVDQVAMMVDRRELTAPV